MRIHAISFNMFPNHHKYTIKHARPDIEKTGLSFLLNTQGQKLVDVRLA
jgi:hypothetical protein